MTEKDHHLELNSFYLPFNIDLILRDPLNAPLPQDDFDLKMTCCVLGLIMRKIHDPQHDPAPFKAILLYLSRFEEDLLVYGIATLRLAEVRINQLMELGEPAKLLARRAARLFLPESTDQTRELLDAAHGSLQLFLDHVFPSRKFDFPSDFINSRDLQAVIESLEEMSHQAKICTNVLAFDWFVDAWNEDRLLFHSVLGSLMREFPFRVLSRYRPQLEREAKQCFLECLERFLLKHANAKLILDLEGFIGDLMHGSNFLEQERSLKILLDVLHDKDFLDMVIDRANAKMMRFLTYYLIDGTNDVVTRWINEETFANLVYHHRSLREAWITNNIPSIRFFIRSHDWNGPLHPLLDETSGWFDFSACYREIIQSKIRQYQYLYQYLLLLLLVQRVASSSQGWRLVPRESLLDWCLQAEPGYHQPFEIRFSLKSRRIHVVLDCPICTSDSHGRGIAFVPCIVMERKSGRNYYASTGIDESLALFLGKLNLLVLYATALSSRTTQEEKRQARLLIDRQIRGQFQRHFQRCPHFDWLL